MERLSFIHITSHTQYVSFYTRKIVPETHLPAHLHMLNLLIVLQYPCKSQKVHFENPENVVLTTHIVGGGRGLHPLILIQAIWLSSPPRRPTLLFLRVRSSLRGPLSTYNPLSRIRERKDFDDRKAVSWK